MHGNDLMHGHILSHRADMQQKPVNVAVGVDREGRVAVEGHRELVRGDDIAVLEIVVLHVEPGVDKARALLLLLLHADDDAAGAVRDAGQLELCITGDDVLVIDLRDGLLIALHELGGDGQRRGRLVGGKALAVEQADLETEQHRQPCT